jgi:hypothetical protein
MATNYPNSLDILINPTATDNLNSTVVPHAEQHANLNDAMEAVQTILGLNPSGNYLTIKDRMAASEALNGLNDVTITSVAAGNVLRYNGSKWVNYVETNLTDGGNF